MLDPTIQNLSFLSQSIQSDPQEYSEIENAGKKYSVQFISPIVSPDGNDYLIELIFNGDVVDAKVCRKRKKWIREDRKMGRYEALIDFYEKALLAFKNGNTQLYLSFFSPESQARLSSVFGSMSSDQLARYIAVTGGDTHQLKFILDAGQLKFLFYQTVTGGNLYYDTVEEVGAGFQIVNYNFQTEFDGLLTSDVFVKELKNLTGN